MDLKELELIVRREFLKHGLHDWTFGLARTKRRLGVCKYRPKRIEIAEYYARNSSLESVIDTLLHEMAHALAGPAAQHGPAWKSVAIRLGAIPRAYDHSPETVVQPGDWQTTCPACKKTFHRYKRPKTLSGYRCKCEARSPLVFEFKGDPTFEPTLSPTLQKSAKWEAKCSGCEVVHLRLRSPKAGVWRCKCPQRCEITWRLRTRTSPSD